MTEPRVEPQREMLSLVTARVRDAYIRRPLIVEGDTDLVSLCRELSARGLTHALVRDGDLPDGSPRLGMFTTTDLRDALLRERAPSALAVREVARFALVEVQADAEVSEALWLMVKHRVHRLLVRDGVAIVGVLGQLDLVSFVAHHSHIVAMQIDDATGLDELRLAARRIDELIVLLQRDGIRIERIAGLVGELNARLFAKAWSLIVPAHRVADSCLLVMGSEGRGEQILKTDQDNALLLRDGVDWPELPEVRARFQAALADFGYPPCPGGVMLTNPAWCQPVSAFRETLRGWAQGSDPEGPMRLAIFVDAVCVAGDATLLSQAREILDPLCGSQAGFLARFAAAADQFQEPGNWFTRLTQRRDEQWLDLKKLGTFPIVHGIRALSLEAGLRMTGTAARIGRLVELGRLEPALARDLLDALHHLMALRLSHQLRQRTAGAPPGDAVRGSDLGALEREPLRDALAIVRRFRLFLRQHFSLDALP